MATSMAALLGFGDKIDQKAAEDRFELLSAIQAQIFCQKSGSVLDISDAVLVRITAPKGNGGKALNDVLICVTSAAFDAIGGEEHVRNIATRSNADGFTIIRGGDYTKKGALRAPVRRAREQAQQAQELATAS